MNRILGPTQMKVLEFIRMHEGCTFRDVSRNIPRGDVKKALKALRDCGILKIDTARSKDSGIVVNRYYYDDE